MSNCNCGDTDCRFCYFKHGKNEEMTNDKTAEQAAEEYIEKISRHEVDSMRYTYFGSNSKAITKIDFLAGDANGYERGKQKYKKSIARALIRLESVSLDELQRKLIFEIIFGIVT